MGNNTQEWEVSPRQRRPSSASVAEVVAFAPLFYSFITTVTLVFQKRYLLHVIYRTPADPNSDRLHQQKATHPVFYNFK